MIDKSYSLDMLPMDPIPVVEVSQYDTDFQILMLLYASNGDLDLSGTSATLRGRKPDGTPYEKAVYKTGQSVVLQGDTNLTDVAGKGIYEICLTSQSKDLHTSNFILRVEPSPGGRE